MKKEHSLNSYGQAKSYKVVCPKYKKEAEVTILYRLRQRSNADLQLTPNMTGMKCSLWEEKYPFCLECPVVQK